MQLGVAPAVASHRQAKRCDKTVRSCEGRRCAVLPQSRVRDPPRGGRAHLRHSYHLCNLRAARQQSQRSDAVQHAGVEALERNQARLASPAALQRDERHGNAGVRPRFEPAHVDVPQTREEALVLLEQLQQDTAQWGTEEGINLVALGGGVASTLAAFLVHSVFEARCVGVFGIGRRTTEGQLQRARTLAECLGIELWELPTADDGAAASREVSVGETEAIRHPELAATVAAVASWLTAPEFDGATVVLFDGRHAEDLAGFDWPEYRRESWWDGSEDSGDLLSPTRAMALESWDVTPEAASPEQPAEERALRVSLLARLPEVAVRAVAKEAGLPNWAWLDPRYSYDMECAEPSSSGLPVIDTLPAAESLISEVLDAGDDAGIRLRVEGTSSSVLEVEASLLPRARELHQQLESHLRGLGLPPVSLQPAPRSDSDGGDSDAGSEDVPGAAASPRFGGSEGTPEKAAGATVEQHGEDAAVDKDSSGGSSGAQASLECMQEHINGSNVSRVTAELAGRRADRPDSRHADSNGSDAGSGSADALAAEVGSVGSRR